MKGFGFYGFIFLYYSCSKGWTDRLFTSYYHSLVTSVGSHGSPPIITAKDRRWKQTTHDPPTYLPRMTVISSHRPLSRLEGAGYGIYLFFLVHSLIDRMTRDQQIEDNSFKVIKDRIFIIIILLTPPRFPFSLRSVMKEKDTNKGTDQTRRYGYDKGWNFLNPTDSISRISFFQSYHKK